MSKKKWRIVRKISVIAYFLTAICALQARVYLMDSDWNNVMLYCDNLMIRREHLFHLTKREMDLSLEKDQESLF